MLLLRAVEAVVSQTLAVRKVAVGVPEVIALLWLEKILVGVFRRNQSLL
jgi:hypothetical protein